MSTIKESYDTRTIALKRYDIKPVFRQQFGSSWKLPSGSTSVLCYTQAPSTASMITEFNLTFLWKNRLNKPFLTDTGIDMSLFESAYTSTSINETKYSDANPFKNLITALKSCEFVNSVYDFSNYTLPYKINLDMDVNIGQYVYGIVINFKSGYYVTTKTNLSAGTLNITDITDGVDVSESLKALVYVDSHFDHDRHQRLFINSIDSKIDVCLSRSLSNSSLFENLNPSNTLIELNVEASTATELVSVDIEENLTVDPQTSAIQSPAIYSGGLTTYNQKITIELKIDPDTLYQDILELFKTFRCKTTTFEYDFVLSDLLDFKVESGVDLSITSLSTYGIAELDTGILDWTASESTWDNQVHKLLLYGYSSYLCSWAQIPVDFNSYDMNDAKSYIVTVDVSAYDRLFAITSGAMPVQPNKVFIAPCGGALG